MANPIYHPRRRLNRHGIQMSDATLADVTEYLRQGIIKTA